MEPEAVLRLHDLLVELDRRVGVDVNVTCWDEGNAEHTLDEDDTKALSDRVSESLSAVRGYILKRLGGSP